MLSSTFPGYRHATCSYIVVGLGLGLELAMRREWYDAHERSVTPVRATDTPLVATLLCLHSHGHRQPQIRKLPPTHVCSHQNTLVHNTHDWTVHMSILFHSVSILSHSVSILSHSVSILSHSVSILSHSVSILSVHRAWHQSTTTDDLTVNR